jgi:hypothetical protein
MTENIKVRRPLTSHLFHLLWILLTLYKTIDSQSPGRYIWGLLFSIAVILLVRVIIKGSYLEKDGSNLIINEDFFRTRIVQIADIERVEIEAGPFSDSRIILRDDKGKIKFNYHNVNDDDFNALMKSLNVPVG